MLDLDQDQPRVPLGLHRERAGERVRLARCAALRRPLPQVEQLGGLVQDRPALEDLVLGRIVVRVPGAGGADGRHFLDVQDLGGLGVDENGGDG